MRHLCLYSCVFTSGDTGVIEHIEPEKRFHDIRNDRQNLEKYLGIIFSIS